MRILRTFELKQLIKLNNFNKTINYIYAKKKYNHLFNIANDQNNSEFLRIIIKIILQKQIPLKMF